MQRFAFVIAGILVMLFSFLVLFLGSPLGRVNLAKANLPYLDVGAYNIAVAFTLIFIVGFILFTGGIVGVSGVANRFGVGVVAYLASAGLFGAYGVYSNQGELSFRLFADVTFIRFCLSWPYQMFAAAFNAPPFVL